MDSKEKLVLETKFCRFLRAKSPYGGMEGGQNIWRFVKDSNAICWCLKSSGGAGPDNGAVAPEKCVEGRICYETPKE